MLFNAWAFTLTFNLWMYSNPIYVVLTYLYNSIKLIKPLFCNYLLILMLFETRMIFSSVEHKRKCLAECTGCPFFIQWKWMVTNDLTQSVLSTKLPYVLVKTWNIVHKLNRPLLWCFYGAVCPFWSLKALVPIHFHCIKKQQHKLSSKLLILKKKSHMVLELYVKVRKLWLYSLCKLSL